MEENKVKLFSIIFYFNFISNKERIQIMISKNKINKYIYKRLIKYDPLFEGIRLTKQQVQEAINIFTTFDELKNIFKYYKSNVADLLQIINIF